MDKLLKNVAIAFSDPLFVDKVIKSIFERSHGRSSTSKKLQSSKSHIYTHLKGWRILQQCHMEIREGKLRFGNSFHIAFGK